MSSPATRVRVPPAPETPHAETAIARMVGADVPPALDGEIVSARTYRGTGPDLSFVAEEWLRDARALGMAFIIGPDGDLYRVTPLGDGPEAAEARDRHWVRLNDHPRLMRAVREAVQRGFVPETPEAQAPVSRRTLLTGLATAALAATALAAAPVSALAMDAELERDLADVPSPSAVALDAELIALGERWRAEDDAYDAASAREAELCEEFKLPAMPEALFLRDEDADLGLRGHVLNYTGGRYYFWVGEPGSKTATARSLRQPQMHWQRRAPRPDEGLPDCVHQIERRVPWPERQARADEIVAAYDAHIAATVTARESSGVTAAEAEARRLGKIVSATTDEIHAFPARTLAGLAVKAAVIHHDINSGYDIEAEVGAFARNVLALAGIAA